MSRIEIPGFEILGLIGRGGMATVWKARQVSLDRTVAIKVLSTHFADAAADIDRFQEEARAAARLKHPGIIQVYDAGCQNGAYFFVMEYVAGYTVGDWQRRKDALTGADAITVAECVSDAMDYAWTQSGMVHCDIKPDNIIIDADGSVKLADLGLSRTIKAMAKRSVNADDEILGTPAYISPEQAMGDPGLDCRSDIYSLGATLYQLVTGRRLFQGHSDAQVMELQCTGQDENPIMLNPSLSKGLCALIEKSLAKDPQFRQADWKAFRSDLARVKAGHLPAELLPGHAISTVKRTHAAGLVSTQDGAHAALDRWERADRSKTFAMCVTIGAVVAGCLVALLVMLSLRPFSYRLPPPVLPPPEPPPDVTTTTIPPTAMPADRARAELESVRRWVIANPEQLQEGLRRMQGLLAVLAGTDCHAPLLDEISKLKTAIRLMAETVMRGLDARTEAAVAAGLFADAAAIYETYAGPGAAESSAERQAKATALRRRAADGAAAPQATVSAADNDAATRKVVAAVVADVLGGRFAAAAERAAAVPRSEAGQQFQDLQAAATLLRQAATTDRRILESFLAQVGREVNVHLASGPLALTVRDVSSNRVTATVAVVSSAGNASRPVVFGVADLAVREKFARMGADDQPEVALVKGVMAFQARAFAHARKFFAAVPVILRVPLLSRMESEEASATGVPHAGAPTQPSTPTTQSVVPHAGAPTQPSTPTTQSVAPPPVAPHPARPAPFLPKDILAVMDNIEGVRNLMYRRNQKLGSDLFTIGTNAASGRAEAVVIGSGSVMDLSPLAALPSLKSVTYRPAGGGRDATGALKDLAGLRGLKLERVAIIHSRVRDIEPLRDMPLRSACFADTPVRDLNPLRGMPLEELDIRRTDVIDLAPLAGMALKNLNIDGTGVRRVQVLKSLPLVSLSAHASPMQDFSWLQGGLKLTHLDLSQTAIRSIDALAGMPLVSLNLSKTSVAEIGSLAGMKLSRLALGWTAVRDFAVIAGMPLTDLNVENTAFSETGLLRGMPLANLNLARTNVKDLAGLEGTGLTALNIQGLVIGDLAPLANLPLKALDCRGCSGLNPRSLHGAPLTRLWLDNPERHTAFVNSLPELRFLNDTDLCYAADSPFRRTPGARPAQRR